MTDEKQILNTNEAAELLTCSSNTLRQSRMLDGKLFGLKPPKYIKMGHSVRYKLSTILEWIDDLDRLEVTPKNKLADNSES